MEHILAVTEINGVEYSVELEVPNGTGLDTAFELAIIEFENQGVEAQIDNLIIF